MKVFGQKRASRPGQSEAGFTMAEYLIASGIVVLVVAAFAFFLQATGVSMVHVTNQSAFNQEAGHAAEFMISRIRLANTATNDPTGDTLTLTFDDNPDVDSDGDKVGWNDIDHFERFRFETGDGNVATLDDNVITYAAGAVGSAAAPLVGGGVRRLPPLPVFSVTNQATVKIHFGLLQTNSGPRSQAIEIRTAGRLRNRLR